MRRVSFPADILDAARETISALAAVGIAIDPANHPKAVAVIAASLHAERVNLQNDVVAAVADESEACQAKVFLALKRAAQQ